MSSRPLTRLDKSDVLAGLFGVWDSIGALLGTMSESDWQAATVLPDWCVHDVVAHLIGTESMLMGGAIPEPDVDVTALRHVRNDIGVMNECWVRALRGRSGADLVDMFRTVSATRRGALSDLTEDDWNAVTMTPAGPDTYGRFMRIRAFDCWIHEHDIREALRLPADDAELATPAARLTLDEMAAAMGRVVGKLAGAPAGSRVSIALTGPLRRVVSVAVQDRGQVVADFGGAQPTATIELDGLLFTRLAAGRATAEQHPGAVHYGGDTDTGRRIVDNLAYVI